MRVTTEFWIIFIQEYRLQALRKSLLVLSSVVLLVALGGIVIGPAVVSKVKDGIELVKQRLVPEYGYVDLVGVVPEHESGPLRYASKAEGLRAVEQGEIAILFVLPVDFADTGEIEEYTAERAGALSITITINDVSETRFVGFLKASVVADLSLSPAVERVVNLDRTDFVVEGEAAEPPVGQKLKGRRFLAAAGVGFVFMFAISVFGSMLPQRLLEEKETRMVELLLSSAAPEAILSGKLAGCLAAAFSHGAVWLIALHAAASRMG